MSQNQNPESSSDLFKRYPQNPILTPDMWPYRINSVFNAGSILYEGKVLLLVRVEDMRGISHLSKAISSDGLKNWTIDTKPTLAPDENYPEEHYGIEDPRIIKLEDISIYAIAYTSFSKSGPLVSIATTEDFKVYKRIGAVMPPEDKDASLFPKLFKGRWAMLHRPTPSNTAIGAHIWISFSPDLIHWGENSILIPARKGSWWDAYKIGLGPPPIETKEGWVVIYHGVKSTASGGLYRLGLALLDLDDPTKLIKRCDEWVFGPREMYERVGDVSNVTFPCGVILKGDELMMYYGSADTTISVAIASMKDVMEFILNSKS